MKENRPDFRDIKSFEEFNRYYWYREELSQICKYLGLEYRSTKQELNDIIEQYFKGNRVEKSVKKVNKKQTEEITLNTPLLECDFTIQDMLKVYYGESNYAKYDHSVCQWNQFLKDFCSDEFSDYYSNKLKVATILWKEVRDSTNEKIYSRHLLEEYKLKIEEYHK